MTSSPDSGRRAKSDRRDGDRRKVDVPTTPDRRQTDRRAGRDRRTEQRG